MINYSFNFMHAMLCYYFSMLKIEGYRGFCRGLYSLHSILKIPKNYIYPKVTYSEPKVTHSDPTHLPLPPPTSPDQNLAIS